MDTTNNRAGSYGRITHNDLWNLERYTGFSVNICIYFVILCPWEEIAGNVVDKVCELLVPQTIHNYQIDIWCNIQ